MEEKNESAFNEASFKMKRLDLIQQECNTLRLNPYILHTKNLKMQFHSHFDCLMSLYQEISSKLTGEEKKVIRPKLLELRKEVIELSGDYMETPFGMKFQKSDENKDRPGKVEQEIFDCEELLRKYLDVHGFSTLNQENLEGDSYN